VAVDGSDNLYVADGDNNTIRKITPTVAGGATNWVVTTIAGSAGNYGLIDGTAPPPGSPLPLASRWTAGRSLRR